MMATQKLHELGQSIWLDNITRNLLTGGGLQRYIDELSVTGLTSNPTIFDRALKNSTDYDTAIQQMLNDGKSGENLFFELAVADLTQAADLFRPIHEKTNGLDGWVSLEVSPLLAYDMPSTIAAAKELHARAGRPNLFIKIPGTTEGLPAIEEAIFAGVPVNVTLTRSVYCSIWHSSPACARGSTPCFGATGSISPNSEPFCMSRCGLRKLNPSPSTARTWSPKYTPYSTRWLASATAFAMVGEKATPAAAFAT